MASIPISIIKNLTQEAIKILSRSKLVSPSRWCLILDYDLIKTTLFHIYVSICFGNFHNFCMLLSTTIDDYPFMVSFYNCLISSFMILIIGDSTITSLVVDLYLPSRFLVKDCFLTIIYLWISSYLMIVSHIVSILLEPNLFSRVEIIDVFLLMSILRSVNIEFKSWIRNFLISDSLPYYPNIFCFYI